MSNIQVGYRINGSITCIDRVIDLGSIHIAGIPGHLG